jgi:hypothetical protein
MSIEIDYERYEHPMPENPNYYGFIEVDADFLQTIIPVGVHWSEITEYDEDGEVIGTRQKTVEEYTSSVVFNKDKTKAVIRLCAVKRKVYRDRHLTKEDFLDWFNYLAFFGQDITTIMNIEEKNTLMQTDDYRIDEEI